MDPEPSTRRWASWVLLAVVLAAGSFRVHNLDIWLHARTGEWIVEHGEVPSTNVLSVLHADHPTVQDKWLFQVLVHGLFDGFGPSAVILARLALMLALFAVLLSTARRLGAGEVSAALFLMLALTTMRSRFMFRPGLMSLFFLAVVVHVVLTRRADGRRTWPLLGLQILWANIHGYFILGPVAVLTVAAGHALAGRSRRPVALRFGALGLAMLGVCLINPAGLEGALHPVSILADLRANYDFYSESIVEFRGSFHPDPREPYDRLAFVVLAVAALAALGGRAWQRWRSAPTTGSGVASETSLAPSLTLMAVFFVQTLSLRRNMAPFVVVIAPLAAACATRGLAPLRARLSASGLWGSLGGGLGGGLVVAALAAAVMLGDLTDVTSIHDGIERRSGWGMSAIAYPDAGVAFIAEHFPDEQVVYTDFGYGSTFTGQRWPDQVAATDGNTHGYPTAHLKLVMAAASGQEVFAFDELTDRHELSVALIPMAQPLSTSLVHHEGWTLVKLGREEAVWVRRGWAEQTKGAAWLAQHDLLARLSRGEAAAWVGTPDCGSLLGLARRCLPQTEIDQATLLLAAGALQAARDRAGRAVDIDPGHPDALGLAGLLDEALGRPDRARELLLRSRSAGVSGALGASVSRALERFDSD